MVESQYWALQSAHFFSVCFCWHSAVTNPSQHPCEGMVSRPTPLTAGHRALSSAWKSTWFATRGPGVQIPQRPPNVGYHAMRIIILHNHARGMLAVLPLLVWGCHILSSLEQRRSRHSTALGREGTPASTISHFLSVPSRLSSRGTARTVRGVS